MCCCLWRALAAIWMDYHRGNTSNCQLFSKNIKTSITNSKRKKKIRKIGVSKKHILFIARTLLDNTTKKCEVYIGPILIYYYCLTRDHREKERRLVFVSDLYFSTEVTMKQSNMFSMCFIWLVQQQMCNGSRICFNLFKKSRFDHWIFASVDLVFLY